MAKPRRYFERTQLNPGLVIGHNDAISWPTLRGLRDGSGDPGSYLSLVSSHGSNVLRVMLEYGQDDEWYFDTAAGQPNPQMVRYWDRLIEECETFGIQLLVCFWDTYHLLLRWQSHPYAAVLAGPESFCTDPEARRLQKARIQFFLERWANSPAIFGYDLFNELDPCWGGTPAHQYDWVTDIARFTRRCERKLARGPHPLTVSCFGPAPAGVYGALVFRHPDLDFATTHVYASGSIDNPENAIDCALTMRSAVRHGLESIRDGRPYLDTESGPIHAFLDLKKQLPESFDDSVYHNMSWAHVAAGGAGSGMRWPFRDPHQLTMGMHRTQRAMRAIAEAIDWGSFDAISLDFEVPSPFIAFGVADGRQGLIWVLRDDRLGSHEHPELTLGEPFQGDCEVTMWDPSEARVLRQWKLRCPCRIELQSTRQDIVFTLRSSA